MKKAEALRAAVEQSYVYGIRGSRASPCMAWTPAPSSHVPDCQARAPWFESYQVCSQLDCRPPPERTVTHLVEAGARREVARRNTAKEGISGEPEKRTGERDDFRGGRNMCQHGMGPRARGSIARVFDQHLRPETPHGRIGRLFRQLRRELVNGAGDDVRGRRDRTQARPGPRHRLRAANCRMR